MKKKKSMLGILALALLLVFGFTACGNDTIGNGNGDPDNPFVGRTFIGPKSIINFTSDRDWEAAMNPSFSGTFFNVGDVAYLTVTHENGERLTVPGTGTVTIYRRDGIIIVVIIITIGDRVYEDEATEVPDHPSNRNPTFRGIQGSWVNAWTPNVQNNRRAEWFTVSANQLSIFDISAGEVGVNFRTGFIELAAEEVRNVVPATEVSGINQERMIQSMNNRLLAMLNQNSPDYLDLSNIPNVTRVGNNWAFWGSWTIPGLDAALGSFSAGLIPHGVDWETLHQLNSAFISTEVRDVENFFRSQLGINFHPFFNPPSAGTHNMIGALAEYPWMEWGRAAMGFTASTFGLIGAGNTAPILINPPATNPRRVVPFEWSLYHWEGSIQGGNLHGIWVDVDGTPANQLIIILGTANPNLWQTQMPLPIGVYRRGTGL